MKASLYIFTISSHHKDDSELSKLKLGYYQYIRAVIIHWQDVKNGARAKKSFVINVFVYLYIR